VKAIYALYSRPDWAQRAVNDLRSAGISDDAISVLSSEPLEGYDFARQDRGTWMPWIAGLGGLAGLTAGYLLTSVTQTMRPINTGGMPIVSNWTNMIVMYELTMLCAVLATVATFFISAKVPSRRPGLYDPEIWNGMILVGVEKPGSAEIVERTLRGGGRGIVKVIKIPGQTGD